MATIEEHRTQFRKGSNSYSVEVITQAEDDGSQRRVAVQLGASDPDGRAIADGRLEVDFDELAGVAEVLSGELLAAAGLPVRSRRRSARPDPANLGKPWTEELDAELEKRWLAGETAKQIADHFGRTQSAVQRRLPLVGCDPYQPGAYLPPPPSQRD